MWATALWPQRAGVSEWPQRVGVSEWPQRVGVSGSIDRWRAQEHMRTWPQL